MDFLGRRSPPSRITIDTDWVVGSHIFTEFSPPMIIPSRCSAIALVALVSRVQMSEWAEFFHLHFPERMAGRRFKKYPTPLFWTHPPVKKEG